MSTVARRAWVDQVERRWVFLGLTPERRRALRDDLEGDLQHAVDDGAPLSELLAEDPDRFARAMAEGLGETPSGRLWRPEWPYSRVNLAAVLVGGAAAGFLIALFTTYWAVFALRDANEVGEAGEIALAVVAHALAASLALGGSLVAAWWAFPNEVRARRVLLVLGGGVLVGGLLSIWPTMRLAAALDYRTLAPIIVLEVALVIGFCLAGAFAARALLERRTAH